MKITLLAVGQKMPDWVSTAYQEYAKRLSSDVKLDLVELPQAVNSKKVDVATSKRKESELILKALPDHVEVIALDERGKPWSTKELSAQLQGWKNNGRDVFLLVGGPDGLDQQCLELASKRWSLSNLTFPHPLVRILVAEQLYRAQSILNNHPYHRA